MIRAFLFAAGTELELTLNCVKKSRHLVAYLLLLLLAGTLVPYSAFNHHCVPEASVNHTFRRHHVCPSHAASEPVCKDECRHAEHVRAQRAECFICSFHFDKQYEVIRQPGIHSAISPGQVHASFGLQPASSIVPEHINKGPPYRISLNRV
jgi:hypothetical protein